MLEVAGVSDTQRRNRLVGIPMSFSSRFLVTLAMLVPVLLPDPSLGQTLPFDFAGTWQAGFFGTAVAGNATGDNLGYPLGLIGDVDGDGVPELAAGAPQIYFFQYAQGYVLVLSGSFGTALQAIFSPPGTDWFGVSVAGAGDVNLDGAPELILGSPREPVPGPAQVGSGRAKVYSLSPLPFASVATVGAGCGGGPVAPQLFATLPVLGQTAGMLVMNAAPNRSGGLYASAVPVAPLAFSSGCTIHLDPATLAPLADLTTDNIGIALVLFTLPTVPSFAGAELALQAVLFPTAGPLGFDLTNGLVVRLGY
jgi:hypothetical protein